jgi:hypothetical protein
MVTRDWEDAETWAVGDAINAENWTERVHDPLTLLLRRPLTIARRTTDKVIPINGVQTIIDFSVIDKDDDGMVQDDIAAANIDTFYAQRDGVYSACFSATFEGTGNNATHTCASLVKVNGISQVTRAGAVIGGVTTQDNWRSVTTDVNLAEGDAITFYAYNTDTATTINIKAQFNSPRACIIWRRPLGS